MILKTLPIALALIAIPTFAQTWKWVDERGVTTYGTKPPPGRPAQLVDTQPRGPVDLSEDEQKRLEAQARRRADLRAAPLPSPPQAPQPAAPQAHGMAFDTYIRLDRGMSEAEFLVRAGRPDDVTYDTLQPGLAKLYYYYPTRTDPFITVVTVRGGQIDRLERTRKF